MSQDNPDDAPQTSGEEVPPGGEPTPETNPDETNLEDQQPQDVPPSTPKEPSKPESPPRPIGPMQDLDKIVKESLLIVAESSKQLDKQKHFLASSAYMLFRLQCNMDDYREHVSRINSFLVVNDLLQENWYQKFLQILPPYGDYSQVLNDDPEKIIVNEIPVPIAEANIKAFVLDVMNNLYAGGLQVMTQRIMNVKVNHLMKERREKSAGNFFPWDLWMKMLSRELKNEDDILEKYFEVSSYMEFLTWGVKKDSE